MICANEPKHADCPLEMRECSCTTRCKYLPPETVASPATGVSHLWCPGKHAECSDCLLREGAPHGEWAVLVSRIEPSHPCVYRQVKL